jgi:hypothetical protein
MPPDRVIRLTSDEGRSVLVEVGGAPSADLRRDAIPKSTVADAGRSLEAVISQLAPITEAIVATVRDTTAGAEVEVEFAVKVSADANLIIAKTTGEANFRVKFKWVRDSDGPEQTR